MLKSTIAKDTCGLPYEISHLREVNIASLEPHVALAHIWTAFAMYAINLRSSPPPGRLKIVHFEDMLTSPRATADDVYKFLKMPFSPAVEHRIMQVTETGFYTFEGYGTIQPSLCSWGRVLTKRQVTEIEVVCKEMMKNIGYS